MKGVKETFGIAGLGIGLGLIGKGFDSEPMMQAGQTATNFVPIAANLSGALITMDLLKQFPGKRI